MLEHYHQLLKKYHYTLDLMSERGLSHIHAKFHHAQQYANFIQQQYGPAAIQIVDIGSGAGLPAIPIAVALPQAQLHLVERRRKRASFLHIVVSQLGLSNVTVHSCDVQKLELPQPIHAVTALAVGNFGYLYCMCKHLLADKAWLISRKGQDWRQDVATLPVPYHYVHQEDLLADGTGGIEDSAIGTRGEARADSKLIAVQL